MPQVTFQAAARWYRHLFASDGSPWDEAFLAEIRGGQPQLGRNPSLFVDTSQLSLGLEWSRRVSEQIDWVRFYTNTGIGWRNEQLLGREELLGERSESADRAVLLAETGFEFDAARLSRHMRLRLRIGVTGWLPSWMSGEWQRPFRNRGHLSPSAGYSPITSYD